MFISVKNVSDLKLCLIGSKRRSQGQILETMYTFWKVKFDPMLSNLCQNVCHHENKENLNVGHVGSKITSFDQTLKKCVHSVRQSFDPICMKLCQNVCQFEISDKFETGSCVIKK